MEEVILDQERQGKAREYARIGRRLLVVDLLIGGIYAIVWLIFGWVDGLKSALLSFTSNEWLLVASFAAVFGGIYYLIILPLSYYEGFVLPHRFGQSTQSLRGWLGDQLKSLLLGVLIGGLLLEVIYAVLRTTPELWWLWAALILLIFNVVLANLAPVLLFPIFYNFVSLGDEYTELEERLLKLAERTNTHVKGVYKFDMSRRTKAANAALTGLGNTRRIILGDTLLKEFSIDEVEAILAHELGHHANRDIPKSIFIQSTITLVGFYFASLVLEWGTQLFGFQGPADIAALPVFMLVIGLYGLVTMPMGNGFSRWRERVADKYAVNVTRNGKALASALTRLANQNLAEVDPEPWVEFLLYSHPTLDKRIKSATQEQ